MDHAMDVILLLLGGQLAIKERISHVNSSVVCYCNLKSLGITATIFNGCRIYIVN